MTDPIPNSSSDSSREPSPTITSPVHAESDTGKQSPPSEGFSPDLEQNTGKTSNVADPFNLRNGLRSDEDLSELRHRKKNKRKAKAVAKYQDQQNELIGSLLKPMQEHTEDARLAEDTNRIPVKIAIYASMAANLGLCILQLYAAISAASFSILATGIDSLFDLGSNVLLWYINHKSKKMDVNKWPVGGARLENIGNISFMVESARDLITHNSSSDTNTFHLPSILAVAAALGVKILLFFYCLSLRKMSNQVHVLWEDHRNDIFLNGFGVLMSAGGSKLRWWLDPTGALIIGVGILLTWGRTIYRQFELLAGKSAPNEFLKLLTYNAMTFSEDIEKVDTVRAYHLYFVEIDIVMKSDTPLWKAHDASQLLQDLIEELPNVERAFVHVDHEATHTPEHRKDGRRI
ncbi:CDF-like metal transporter [Gymnopus androsaceus JB14]|uniref:CDF-like metal transporter n=1 Tax=Gymnopus androsaceus JB14 TaxID=1447944 RepID=A0A6A4GR04_9AGAR|nr:CDF-like metal transporter [Gymnopus androsaceus JB14]